MDLNNPQDFVKAMVKLRGSLDGATQLWWYKGFQYGVVDRQPTLLWLVEGAQLGKYVAKGDGSYDHVFHDVMFYVNPETGDLLEKFKNPYTGETNEAPDMRMGPFTNNHSATGAELQLPPNLPPGAMEVGWRYEPAVIQGDDVYINESATTKIANPAAGKPGAPKETHFYINDFFTLTGKMSDIENDDLPSAPAKTNYTSLNAWTPWMNMGAREGSVLGRGNSTKLKDYDDLPKKLRGWIEKREPSFFEDPEFVLWEKPYTPLNQEG